MSIRTWLLGVVVVVMRAVRVVQVIVVIAIPQTSIIRLGFLVFFLRGIPKNAI